VASSLDICKSRYNNAESDGYKTFHVTKVLRGREKKEEREGSERFVRRPATAHVSRGNSSLAASVLALGRRFALRLDLVSPLSFAPNQVLPAPNQALPRQIPEPPLKIERPRVKSPNSPKIEPPLKNPRGPARRRPPPSATALCEMAGKSKRTTAPVPPEFPWPTAQPVPLPAAHPVPPPAAQSGAPLPAIPSMFATGSWLPAQPPQSMAATTPPCWLPGVPQPGDLSQGPWWTPPTGIGVSAQSTPTAGNLDAYNLQAWYVLSPPILVR
jgi:hypothetical protein